MSVPFNEAFLTNHLEPRHTEEQFFSLRPKTTKITETSKTNGGRGAVPPLPPKRFSELSIEEFLS